MQPLSGTEWRREHTLIRLKQNLLCRKRARWITMERKQQQQGIPKGQTVSYNRKEVIKNVFRKNYLVPRTIWSVGKSKIIKEFLQNTWGHDMPKVSKQTGEPLKIGALFWKIKCYSKNLFLYQMYLHRKTHFALSLFHQCLYYVPLGAFWLKCGCPSSSPYICDCIT